MKNQSKKRNYFQNNKDMKVAIYYRFATKEQATDPIEEQIKKTNEYLKSQGYIK